jgi:hypothetical protein
MVRKAVFSYWSAPPYLNRYCGFNNKKDFLNSFALAAYCARLYFKKVVIFTDKVGVSQLDPILSIFDEVHLDLQQLHDQQIPSSLWAYPKIITYSCQKEPFLHIDNDVFFWERPPLAFLHQPIVCQSLEYKMPMYDFCFKKIADSPLHKDFSRYTNLFKKVGWMLGLNRNGRTNPVLTPNLGVFGGTDIDFIQDYSHQVLDILKKKENIAFLRSHDLGDSFNAIYEQWLLSQLAFKEGKAVVPLLKPPPGYRVCNKLGNLKKEHLYEGRDDIKYTHLVAGSKRDPYLADRVKIKASRMLPDNIFDRISTE